MQPFEISCIGLGNELLPNAMLVKHTGNGLFSVWETSDPTITGRNEVTFISVPVESNSQQRLLPILAQTGAAELVFCVHPNRVRDTMITKRHQPSVVVPCDLSLFLSRRGDCGAESRD
jgi:hypothetical protein